MSPHLRWPILLSAILYGCGGSAGKGTDAAREVAGAVDGAAEHGSDLALEATQDGSPDAAIEATPDGLDGAATDAVDGGGLDSQRGDGAPVDASDAEVAPAFVPGSPYRALAVSGGTTHTCVLLDDHKVKCWGMSFLGNLGYGDEVSRGAKPSDMGDALPTVDLGTGRTAVEIGASRYSTCALLDNGQIKCWGYSVHLGLADSTNNHRGDQPGEMGDALPALDLGPGRKAIHLTTGNENACAVLDDGSIKCWSAQKPETVTTTGIGQPVQMAPLGKGVMALYGNGTVIGAMPQQVDVLLAPTDYAVAIFGSVGAGAALLADGSVRFFRGTAPAAITNARALGLGELGPICALAPSGAVRCWGQAQGCLDVPGGATYWCDKTPNADGSHTVQLGQPAVALTSNSYTFMCALLADGSVKCWGGVQGSELGSSVDFTLVHTPQEDRFTYGAWRAIDLGTHR